MAKMTAKTSSNLTSEVDNEESNFKSYFDDARTSNRTIVFAECCNSVTIKRRNKINGEHPKEQVQPLYMFLNLKKCRLTAEECYSHIKKKIEGQSILIQANHFKEQAKRLEKTLQANQNCSIKTRNEEDEIANLKKQIEINHRGIDILEYQRNYVSCRNNKFKNELELTIKDRDKREKEWKVKFEGIRFARKKLPLEYQKEFESNYNKHVNCL